MAHLMREWLGSPSRVASLLGAGVLSVAVVRADTVPPTSSGDANTRMPQQSSKPFADLLIWQEEGRIYIMGHDEPAEELRLGDTAEAEWLRQQLRQQGATADKPHTIGDRIILVGGGGCGFDWMPPGKTAAEPRGHPSDKPATSAPQTSSRRGAASTDPSTVASGQPGTSKKSVYP